MTAITKELRDKLVAMDVKEFTVRWSGGNDEGNLSVDAPTYEAAQLIEDWAWDAFSYSGAGDGTDYGDDYHYDLVKGIVRHSDWFMTRQEGAEEEFDVEITTD